MASVNIVATSGSPYSWANASFIWDSPTSLNTWDGLAPTMYTLTVEEDAISFSDKMIKSPTKKLVEGFLVSEFGSRNAIHICKDGFAISDSYIDYITFMLRVFEGVNFLEESPKNVTSVKKESWTLIDDAQYKGMTSIQKENLNFSEKQSQNMNLLKSESFAMSEKYSNIPTIKKYEAFSLIEIKRHMEMIHMEKENINIAELYADIIGFILRVYEAIAVNEKLMNKSSVMQFESFAIADKRISTSIKVNRELVGFAENYQNRALFNKVFNEIITVADKLVKNYGLRKSEAIEVIESYVRNGNVVLSDLVITDADMTLDEFINMDAPAGYESFKDFIAGDLNYQKALVKTIIETAISGSRPYLTEWALRIDVPDTRDSGFITILAVNTRINFNRKFNVPPEVQVTLRAGTRGIPCVTSIDEDGFYVEIVNAQDQFVAGSIGWSATGY